MSAVYYKYTKDKKSEDDEIPEGCYYVKHVIGKKLFFKH